MPWKGSSRRQKLLPSLRPSLLKSSWISLVEELDGSVAQSSALIRKGPSARTCAVAELRNLFCHVALVFGLFDQCC